MNINYIKTLWQQMLEAVQTIHEARIVHGDLKVSLMPEFLN
jgi:serine/threonine protein kinase